MPIDTTGFGRRSRFVFGATGSQTDLTLALPPRAWERRAPTIGGSRTAASGIPASYIVRRDEVVILPLRFRESEWSAVRDLIAWGQGAEEITWYPDASEPGSSFAVYLESPKAGNDIRPTRLAEYPKVLELTIELRLVSGQTFTEEYFIDA